MAAGHSAWMLRGRSVGQELEPDAEIWGTPGKGLGQQVAPESPTQTGGPGPAPEDVCVSEALCISGTRCDCRSFFLRMRNKDSGGCRVHSYE